jgi:DNA-directed RNA polymerase specialized sigma24 family protein
VEITREAMAFRLTALPTRRAATILSMSEAESTSWRLIEGAARGGVDEREEFARRYAPAARAYFMARWRRSPLRADVADAIQELFVECYRADGVLAKADRSRNGGFRALLFGVMRNVALRSEKKLGKDLARAPESSVKWNGLSDAGPSPSSIFDQVFARTLIREAVARHAAWARTEGDDASNRYELLRLRFEEGLPIRDIAALWKRDSADLHHEYAAARREFEIILRQVIAESADGRTPAEVSRILRELAATIH